MSLRVDLRSGAQYFVCLCKRIDETWVVSWLSWTRVLQFELSDAELERFLIKILYSLGRGIWILVQRAEVSRELYIRRGNEVKRAPLRIDSEVWYTQMWDLKYLITAQFCLRLIANKKLFT